MKIFNMASQAQRALIFINTVNSVEFFGIGSN